MKLWNSLGPRQLHKWTQNLLKMRTERDFSWILNVGDSVSDITLKVRDKINPPRLFQYAIHLRMPYSTASEHTTTLCSMKIAPGIRQLGGLETMVIQWWASKPDSKILNLYSCEENTNTCATATMIACARAHQGGQGKPLWRETGLYWDLKDELKQLIHKEWKKQCTKHGGSIVKTLQCVEEFRA